LNAVLDFGQRVAPELLKLKEMANELQELQGKTETFRAKIREQEREIQQLRPQVDSLRSRARKAEADCHSQVKQAFKERDQAIRLAEEIPRLRKFEDELAITRQELQTANGRLSDFSTRVRLTEGILHLWLY